MQNPQGDYIFHTSSATSGSGFVAEFGLPNAPYGFTDYLYTSPKSLPALTEGETITATLTLTSVASLEAGPWGSQAASPPAVVYLFIQANTPTSSQNQTPPSCGLPPGYSDYNYWWAAATPVTDSSGNTLGTSFTLTAILTPSSWSGICGNQAADPQFSQALASATEVGLAFGGGHPSQFGANGIGLTSGTAALQLISYTIN
ncbi:MAG: hypothetical protein JRM80_01795 [Nitrososphaerota archaeon]|nr:hypothetical protein [Nitrososphaerota archaeon]